MSPIHRLTCLLGIEEWCEGSGVANQLIGNMLIDADEWLESVAGGKVRLPFMPTLYTERAHFEELGCILLGFGIPRSRMGPRLLKHLPPDPSRRPTLRVVS